MLGLRTGLRFGLRPGLALGLAADQVGGSLMAGVTLDAAGNRYFPANATEWTITMAAAGIASGGPSLLWNCQDASGNAADSIGAFPGTAAGTGLSYQQAVAGYTRLALQTTDGSTGTFSNAAGGLPSLATQSQLSLAVIKVITVTTANRNVMRMANVTTIEAQVTTTPRPRIIAGAASNIGGSDPTGVVRPYVLKHDKTNSAQTLYTDQEKISPAFTALSGQNVRIGAGAGNTATAQFLYYASFFLGAAELSDAQVKKLLQVLNWPVAW